MLVGIFRSVVLLLTGLVYYGLDFWLIRHYDRQRAGEGTGRSWGYTSFMIGFWALLVIQPILLPGLGLYTDALWGLVAQGVGVLSVVGGLALHWWARSHLRHFYVEDVQFQDGQYLIDTGPYRLVRHPVFTSFFMIALGLVLVNPAVTTLVMLLYAFIDFSIAARKEEQLLARELPEYAGYMKRTGRFLPKWR